MIYLLRPVVVVLGVESEGEIKTSAAVCNSASVLDFQGQVIGKSLEPRAMISRVEGKNVTINSIYENIKNIKLWGWKR